MTSCFWPLALAPLLVAGRPTSEPGASVPGTRQRIEHAWGASTYDHAGMTGMGAYGFTCVEQRGLHVNEEEFIAEILDVQSGRPVEEGQTGELVLTNLGRWGSPA